MLPLKKLRLDRTSVRQTQIFSSQEVSEQELSRKDAKGQRRKQEIRTELCVFAPSASLRECFAACRPG